MTDTTEPDDAGETIRQLRARVAELEAAHEFQEKQRADAFRRRHMHAPEDPHVYVLCERYGYGAVMDAASRLWARKDSMGAFYIGGCIGRKAPAMKGPTP